MVDIMAMQHSNSHHQHESNHHQHHQLNQQHHHHSRTLLNLRRAVERCSRNRYCVMTRSTTCHVSKAWEHSRGPMPLQSVTELEWPRLMKWTARFPCKPQLLQHSKLTLVCYLRSISPPLAHHSLTSGGVFGGLDCRSMHTSKGGGGGWREGHDVTGTGGGGELPVTPLAPPVRSGSPEGACELEEPADALAGLSLDERGR